jgi:hypothetical protein
MAMSFFFTEAALQHDQWFDNETEPFCFVKFDAGLSEANIALLKDGLFVAEFSLEEGVQANGVSKLSNVDVGYTAVVECRAIKEGRLEIGDKAGGHDVGENLVGGRVKLFLQG